MESESGNPVSKVFFRMKAEIHGVNICLFLHLQSFIFFLFMKLLWHFCPLPNQTPHFSFYHTKCNASRLSLQIYLNLMKCFNYPMRENMMRLAIVWFTLSFGWAPSRCCLCHRKTMRASFLWSDNGAMQSGLWSHCFSVILISLLCKNVILSKSIAVCGSIFVHWCLSTSRKDRKKTFFKIQQKPQMFLWLYFYQVSV